MRRRQIAVVSNYYELVACLRARADTLDVSNLTLDEVAGLQEGYTGKVLAISPSRALGRMSLGALLGALGLKLAVLEDREALARVRPRLVKRRHNGKHRELGPVGGQQHSVVR